MREAAEGKVVISDAHPTPLAAVLMACYTGRVRVPRRAALAALDIADRLGCLGVAAALTRGVAADVNAQTAVAYLAQARATAAPGVGADVASLCVDVVAWNFAYIATAPSLLALDARDLEDVIDRPDLGVKREGAVVAAVTRWVGAHPAGRARHARRLLAGVRWCGMPKEELAKLGRDALEAGDGVVKAGQGEDEGRGVAQGGGWGSSEKAHRARFGGREGR